MNYQILVTKGTAEALKKAGVDGFKVLEKLHGEGDGEGVLDYLMNKKIGLVINTVAPDSKESFDYGYTIRRTAVEFLTPVVTRIETAEALTGALKQNSYGSMLRILCLEDLLRDSPLAKYI